MVRTPASMEALKLRMAAMATSSDDWISVRECMTVSLRLFGRLRRRASAVTDDATPGDTTMIVVSNEC
jgi:hypothetical protein